MALRECGTREWHWLLAAGDTPRYPFCFLVFMTIETAAPMGSDLSALVRGGVPFQHVCTDPAALGNLDTLFLGPGAHSSSIHRK